MGIMVMRSLWKILRNVEWIKALAGCWSVWECTRDLSRIWHKMVKGCGNGWCVGIWVSSFQKVMMNCCVCGCWNDKLGTKAFGDISLGFLKKKIVYVSHTMRLNLCGGCLVQLGRTHTICFKPHLMIHDI
jgi:hypothetical protein